MNNTSARDALIEQIKQSENILVALSANPTIDELTSALGLTLILNKTNDHVTTIFSGEVPSVLNFLEPNKFFDKTVDGLRDFIIALNPEKADRVRTKVVDGMVRVSITPSKGAVTVDDLEFSQGDYNVDLVIALGVQNQADLDKALEAHGRILHSAFVASIGVGSALTELGNLNWQEPALQSYAQIVADLSLNLDPKLDETGQPVDTVLIDSSVATALMTGLVSITERFSNNLTTPEIMSLAAVLMGQGANQQLIAKELDEPNRIEQLKQTLNNRQNQLKNQPTFAPVEPTPAEPEKKLEHEAVINHKETISTVETNQSPAESTEPSAPVVASAPSTTPISAPEAQTTKAPAEASSQSQQSAVDLNQLIDKMVQNSQPKTDATPEPAPIEASESAPIEAPELAPIEPPVVAPISPVEPTLGETTTPVAPTVEQKTDSSKTKDESWDKVNQFKQAFLDKMKQSQAQADQARQAGLDELKQAEPPEPPMAVKPPVEVAEPQTKTSANSAPSDNSDDKTTPAQSASKKADLTTDKLGGYLETPVDLPQVAESTAPKTPPKPKRANLKKKSGKVIRPLAKQPETGPSLTEQIERELSPVAPPTVPPMPTGLNLPPPLPPMPPALDQLTMTGLPPVEVGFDNNPFDALNQAPASATPAASPTPAPAVTSSPAPSPNPAPTAPSAPLTPANSAPAAVSPKPDLDAQLTPQEAQAIGLKQPAPKAPVPENQFVIPE